jgi:hypothetical protein
MSKGGNMFCFPENIENQAKKLFAQLKKDKFLDGLEPEEFAEKAAHVLSELNVIHAFREGNGRSQLSFFLLLAENAGHPIDLEDLDPGTFLNAMIASFEGEEEPIAAVIQGLLKGRPTSSDVVPRRPRPHPRHDLQTRRHPGRLGGAGRLGCGNASEYARAEGKMRPCHRSCG